MKSTDIPEVTPRYTLYECKFCGKWNIHSNTLITPYSDRFEVFEYFTKALFVCKNCRKAFKPTNRNGQFIIKVKHFETKEEAKKELDELK